MVQVGARLFQNTLDASGHRLWLDNLFIVARPRSDEAELRAFLWAAPSGGALPPPAAQPRLWFTNSVLQGNRQSSVGGLVQNASLYLAGAPLFCARRHFARCRCAQSRACATRQRTKALRADTAIVQQRANFAGLIVAGGAAAAALERVELRDISGTGLSSSAVQVLQGGAMRLMGATFDAPSTQYDVTLQSGGAVYADDAAADLRVATGARGDPGEVLPLRAIGAALAARFIDARDDEFLQIRQVRPGCGRNCRGLHQQHIAALYMTAAPCVRLKRAARVRRRRSWVETRRSCPSRQRRRHRRRRRPATVAAARTWRWSRASAP